jgi:hypothetical protein
MCVADSSFSRHISQMGLSISPILKRCPFKWQWPVNSPVTHHNWFLFCFSSSWWQGPCRDPFAYLSPVRDFQYFLWFQFVQSLTTFLAFPPEMPQAGLCPVYASLYKVPKMISWWSCHVCPYISTPNHWTYCDKFWRFTLKFLGQI